MNLRTRPFLLALAVSTFAPLAKAQDATAPPPPLPSMLGFQLPQIGGDVTYALTASQTFVHGYNGGSANVSSSNISGDLAYASTSPTHPFGLIYSGGYLGSESSLLPSSAFQNLALSQEFRGRKWDVVADDTVSYLPESPVGGLSGIAGIGDLGVPSTQVGGYTGPGILTNFDTRVSNVVGVSAQRNFTGDTGAHVSGNYSIERFLENNGVDYSSYDNNMYEAAAGLNHRINARNTIGAEYQYSDFSYDNEPFSFVSNGVNFEYSHHWSPRFVLDVSAGPQFNSSSTFPSTQTNLAASASLAYTGERSMWSASYTRGTNAGSGVVQGTIADSVGVTAERRLSRVWDASANVSYTHSSSLPSLVFPPFTIEGVVAAVQVTHSIGRSFSAFGSYTLERQTTSGTSITSLAFNGLQQVFSAGITYSPSSHHLGKH